MSSIPINDVSQSIVITPSQCVWYCNHYRCPYCQLEWQDEWDCTCNDRCPNCNKEIEPYDSDLIAS